MTNTEQSGERQPRLTQGRAAEQLGVTREHLNRVLRGHRVSPRLLNDYNTLKSQHDRNLDGENASTQGEEKQVADKAQ